VFSVRYKLNLFSLSKVENLVFKSLISLTTAVQEKDNSCSNFYFKRIKIKTIQNLHFGLQHNIKTIFRQI